MTMRVAIVGAGLMGHALALVHALGGHVVKLTDNDPATLAAAGGLMETALATLREAGEVGPEWTAERLAAAVTRVGSLAETLADAELVVEAVYESAEVKRAVFADIDALAPPQAIIASNTSRLDIFPLVPEQRLGRTLIAHWYTPPYLVDLCDVVGGEHTDPGVVETVRAMVAAMGKVPVVMKRFIPGYIANRIQAAIGLEANFLLDEGYATPRDIDDAIVHGLALRMPVVGVMAKADFTGLALLQSELANRSYIPPAVKGYSRVLDRLIAAGRTGVIAGAGYYDWGGKNPAGLLAERDRKLLALKRALRDIAPMRGVEEETP